MSGTGGAMASDTVLERFRGNGALLEGHFLLSSGLHSPIYFQSALLLQHPREAAALAAELAGRIRGALAGGGAPVDPTVVVAPALGGIVIGHELARALGARAIFAEREGGRMSLRRGFRIDPGERAVICEDVITTGRSAREVCSVVSTAGGNVRAVAVLVDRGRGERDFEVPLVSLATLAAPAYPPESCPQCAAGIPYARPGSRGTNGETSR